MKLKEVSIHNFRGIESCKLEFHDRMNLIIGKNGVGKTSILEAIAVGLGGLIRGVDGASSRSILQEDVRTKNTKTGDGSFSKKHFLPTEINCVAVFDKEICEWKTVRDEYSASGTNTKYQPNSIVKLLQKESNNDNSTLPLISYQGAIQSRLQKRSPNISVKNIRATRGSGYDNCLKAEANYIKRLSLWCARMEQIAWQKEQLIGEYEGAKDAVARFMTAMEGGTPCHIYYDKQSEEILYVKADTANTVTSLSAGYQSLIWMVFDLAYRMALLNPELREHISEAPGIVLIDEADMHLHPEWQWLLVDALKKVFPNVQFILATHAPIIIASVKDGAIIDVGDIKNISYSEPAYGLDINDTLLQVQESSGVPGEIAALKQRFYEAIDRGNFDMAKQTVLEIENLIGEDKPIAVEARTSYELEAALEE